ncbi:rod shape-determining protein MreC [Paenibacillus segetis]|uniref:Cell shape-determining protein MreC n=1 Tax=Paenibacillus segetis TaxID=1325360 RepID=A0ABQ1YRE0_9BACL|nr:rod shape-determining protein MreC [Paenibacillus segetis]GGH35901.1 cell shape-determining protein MreC [Paenibacillus segetis]
MYRHKRKLKKSKVIVAVAVIVFVTGSVIATSYYKLYVSLLKDEVFNLVSIYIENKQLKESIELNKIQDMKLKMMEFDNKQLVKAAEAKKQLPSSYSYPIARIIDYKTPLENNVQVESIIIDLGRLDGVKEYESVISLDQYLIGVVTEIKDHTSTIRLINSEAFLKNQGISVEVGEHSTTGVLEYDPLENIPFINRISKDSTININDTVKTNGGDESRYPAGFSLGTISSISTNRFGLTLQATVELPPLSNDIYVFIVH